MLASAGDVVSKINKVGGSRAGPHLGENSDISRTHSLVVSFRGYKHGFDTSRS